MSDLTDVFDRLRRPFPSSAISWRVGNTNAKFVADGDDVKGQPLAYIDARDVMDRLDEVVGPENWQCKYSEQGSKTICSIGVNVGIDDTKTPAWVWKEDGAGDTDMEAEKGALSDAFKRAGVRWGIGRYLYGIKAPKIVVGTKGKFLSISDVDRQKLDGLHDKHIETMEWGDRADRNTYRLVASALRMIEIHELATFELENEGSIAQLPVAMRAHLKEHIGRLRAGTDYQAANKDKAA